MSSGWTLGRHSKWKQKKCVENSTLELWNFPNFLFPFWMLSSTRNELNESEYYKTCAPRIVACQALQMEDWSNSSYSGKFNVEKSPNLSVDCDKNKSHKHLSALLYRIQHFFIQLLITIKSDRRGTILRCLEPSESMKMVGEILLLKKNVAVCSSVTDWVTAATTHLTLLTGTLTLRDG